MKHPTYLIAAVDKNYGIGKNGKLPWHIKDDMLFFQKTTLRTKDSNKQNALIMGRKTWESLPQNHRPLKGRKNIIISQNADYNASGSTVITDLTLAITSIGDDMEKIFIIGGASIFSATINLHEISGIYLTHLEKSFDCDTFFPKIPSHFSNISKIAEFEEKGIKGEYLFYSRQK